MNSEIERPTAKISYEKPTAVDLGPTASIVGVSCVVGDFVDDGGCVGVGNSAFEKCSEFGNSALGCSGTGSSAGSFCDDGSVGADF